MQKRETSSSQQSIERALKLFCIMAESRMAMNITEISKVLGISRSTAYAMVNVMVDMNCLSKDPDTGKYFLGYQIFILGGRARLRYSHILPCDDYLRSMVTQITLPANQYHLCVLEQDYKVLKFLSKNSDGSSGSNSFAEQRVLPFHCTASGRVLVSEQPEKLLQKLLTAQPLTAYTPASMTDPQEILKRIKQVKEQGYEVDIEEYSNFEVNVSAPIRDYSKKIVAAVNVSVSKLLYQNRFQEYIQLAIALAQEMSSILGYRNNM